jgi:hypothetical protein
MMTAIVFGTTDVMLMYCDDVAVTTIDEYDTTAYAAFDNDMAALSMVMRQQREIWQQGPYDLTCGDDRDVTSLITNIANIIIII